MNQNLVSTREAAELLAVSESTVRRWCDVGKLHTIRSPGGHRKVPINSITKLARDLGVPIDHQAIQVPPSMAISGSLSEAVADLCDCLCDGREDPSLAMLMSAYTRGHSIQKIGDELVGPALHLVGKRWESGEITVSIERRACHIVMNGLREIERLIPACPAEAPLAMGVTPGQDFSQVGTQLVALVFKAAGWRAMQLGAGVPFSEIALQCRETKPSLIWLSSVHIEDQQQFVDCYNEYIEPFLHAGITVVIGGRAFSEEVLGQISYSFYGRNLEALDTFVSGLPMHSRRSGVVGKS